MNVDRSLAGLVGINERDTANAMLTTLAGSSQVYPTYWLNPKTGVSYPVSIQTPQQEINTLDDLKNVPVTSGSGGNGGNGGNGSNGSNDGTGPPQLLGGVARHPAFAEQRHRLALQRPTGNRHLRHDAGARSRRCGRRHPKDHARPPRTMSRSARPWRCAAR